MPSGLIQLVVGGSRDLYLVGNAQISFFRSVYRRYTNFSMEAIEQVFQGEVIDFDKTMVCTVDKVADLIHKTYLVLKIPKVNIKRTFAPPAVPDDCLIPTPPPLATAQANFNIVDEFVKVNIRSYRAGFLNSKSPCIENVQIFCDQVVNVWATCDPVSTIRTAFMNLIANLVTCHCGLKFSDIYMVDVANEIKADIALGQDVDVKAELDKAIQNNIRIHQIYLDQLHNAQKAENERDSPFSNFAWVKKLGHTIIDYIDVEIGGRRIDRHYGDWINIWHELSRNHLHDRNYAKLIGDVPELTKFNQVAKPEYTMMIPLQFWFCRHNGLALPLIAMQYYDLKISVKLRPLEQCCFVDNTGTLTGAGISLVDAHLLIDYIYLDTDERRRFAQASHEYLIDQVQRVEFDDFSKTNQSFLLENFEQPGKEFIFVFQRDDFVTNPDDHTECRFNNYTLNKNNTGNPFKTAYLRFNAYDRGPILDGNYYNYVQPYAYHSHTPSDGINVFSVALKPEEQQPSGSANLSRIDAVTLVVQWDPRIELEQIDGKVRVYFPNVNVLRFLSGFAGLAFN
jgi:hypothetical protein